jgi:hypothetical protein
MAFDPTLPATNSPIVSAELRNQFNGLKALVDAQPTLLQVNSAIVNGAAGNCNGVEALAVTVSNPPTQAQVQAIVDKLNELMAALQRT